MTRLSVSGAAKNEQGMLSRLYDLFSRPYLNELLGREISTFSRYFERVLQVEPRPDDDRALLREVRGECIEEVRSVRDLPDVSGDSAETNLYLINGNFNHHFDVQALLTALKPKLTRSSRVCVVVYNSYLRGLYHLANRLGIRKAELPSTFLTANDILTICKISGYELVRSRPVGYVPFSFFGIGHVLNKVLQAVPLLRWMGFAGVLVLRPISPSIRKPSLSILIPARNEKGNIENALKRMPDFDGAEIEVIFVEGHSSDGTWEEILRVRDQYSSRCKIKALQQKGKGKCDAVRTGFAVAEGDLLTILDADLTMPPELLTRFYEAYTTGKADFVNGSRLVYPMEGEAMRFLNWLGNVFFAKALSWVLDTKIGDSLCGTKLVSRKDYKRFGKWRDDFGDFDPFGDFELIYPAAVLGLGIVDIPIRYRARTYGTTNIHRFRHGFMLLKMTLIGLFRIRMPLL